MMPVLIKQKSQSNIPTFSIQAINLRNPEVELQIDGLREFTLIDSIRLKLGFVLGVDSSTIQLFHPCNPSRNIELMDNQSLCDLNMVTNSKNRFIQYSVTSTSPATTISSFSAVKNISISPATVGTSGVYFVENENHVPSAVFKPYDEEQGMMNNPKGFKSKPLKSFFEPGQGVVREYAAYMLDVNNFCKVPRTQLVRLEDESFQYSTSKPGMTYPKLGALQDFVRNGEILSDYGSKMFSDFEIQKIALLDIRLLNCDRNDENVLVVKKDEIHEKSHVTDKFELIPIDHAYCLPAQLTIDGWDWFWFSFPQVRRPVCPEIVKYFRSIEIDTLITNLSNSVSVSSDCLFLLKLVHHVILKSFDKGLTIFDIACIVARTDSNVPSPLERMISEAETNSYNTLEARSSRVNSHVKSDNLSSSFENPKTLSFYTGERRCRSNSVTCESSAWNSPLRKAITSSTEKFISALSADIGRMQMNSEEMSSVSSTIDGSTDLSVGSDDFYPDNLPENCAPFVPIREQSSDSYFSAVRKNKKLKHTYSVNEDFLSIQTNPVSIRPVSSSIKSPSKGWGVSLNSLLPQSQNSDLPNESNNNLKRTFSVSINSNGYRADDRESFDDQEDCVFCSDDRLTDTENDHSVSGEITTSDSSLSCKTTDSNSLSYESQSLVLRRMVSFAAISSAPMYDVKNIYEEKLTEALSKTALEPFDIVKGRRVPKKVLQQHVSHESSEFQRLRQQFAEALVGFLIKRISPNQVPPGLSQNG